MTIELDSEHVSAVLKTAALSTMILFGWAELRPRRTKICGRTRGFTLLDVAHVILSLLMVLLYSGKAFEVFESQICGLAHKATVLFNAGIADFVAAITVAIILAVSLYRFFHAQYTSALLFFVLCLMFTASAMDVFTSTSRMASNTISAEEGSFKKSLVILNALDVFLALGNMFIFSLRDTLVYSRTSCKFKYTGEEESWSPVGVFFCTPVYRNLKNMITGSPTGIDLLVKPSLHTQCARLVRKLYEKFGKRALIAGTSTMAPMVLLFAATSVGEGAFMVYMNHCSQRFTERVQVLCQGAIIRKVMVYSAAARASFSDGYIMSVISVDCGTLGFSAQLVLPPLAGLMSMPLVLYMLSTRVGFWPGLGCGSLLLLALGGFWVAVAVFQFLQKRSMKMRDERLNRMLDLLNCIRTVKMYAWERNHLESLKRNREQELKYVLSLNVVSGIIDALYSAFGSLLIIVMYGTLSLVDPTRILSAAESFSSVYLLSIIETFCVGINLLMRTLNATGISANRVITLCTAEEAIEDEVETADSCGEKGEVYLQDCTFTRSSDDSAPALKGINLSVTPGSLVAIVGFVGSGKSTLLAAILGDLHRTDGSVRIRGNIGYVPQVATVFNATLRDNILFGKEYDPGLYRRVLDVCDLFKDIATLPAGDLTEIGERGHNLSGGQKQRVSLARAAYHECSIYVLDDPLSALDPTVGSRVYRRLIGSNGLLKNKTRLLVTNQGYLLKDCDQLYLMCGKTGVSYSRYSDLLKDSRAPTTLHLGLTTTAPAANDKSTDTFQAGKDPSKGVTIKEEKSASTKSTWEVVWTTAKMCGACLWPGVLCLAASALATSWQLVWIKQWTDSSSSGSYRSPFDSIWIYGLAGLSLGAVGTRLIGNVFLAFAINRLCRVLHHEMLEHVLFSPVSFFDCTPRGRILNRFTADLSDIDIRMASMGRQTIQNGFLVISRLAVIGTESLVVVAIGIFVFIVFVVGTVMLTHAVNVMRFIRSSQFSRVLHHATETVESLTTIRVFGMTQRFYGRFCRLADETLRASLASVTCQRLTRAFTIGCSQTVVFATLVFTVVFSGSNDEGTGVAQSSSIGLALNSSLGIPLTMVMVCVTFLGVVQLMVALERDIEFTQLPKEEEVEIVAATKTASFRPSFGNGLAPTLHRLDREWPTEGRVEFQNFSASYRPTVLEDSLKNVSFTVYSREKVGIVGRTGAGKSSLVLALLRVLKSTGGHIFIDGVDIASVPLPVLRTAITVIPQDPSLVRGTLRANLDPTNVHTEEELWKVLDQTHLSEFVARQPMKLLLETGDGGSNLSVGQRQLVCLARALLRRPRILVLDEATSQMDGDTDRLIQATLRESFANFTLLTVAHRLHTVLDYDRILVMSDGTVVEYGPIPQLLNDRSSTFYDMALKAGIVSGATRAGRHSSESSTHL
ncbi:ATP-binding cassette sub-family C member 2-like isoform X2 [Haemaphysalis longicornis]